MYHIPHKEFYKLYDAFIDEITYYFYSKDELVKFIAKKYQINESDYKLVNPFIEQCTCNIKELFINNGKRYILYDNFDRVINIYDFKEDAFLLYKKWEIRGRNNIYSWKGFLMSMQVPYKYRLYKKLKYKYRQEPVPYTSTRKWRGGPNQSPPHTARIIRMYANPEYKDFNRDSVRGVPRWWDDRYRRVQRSWKEQSRARHQWQRGKF